MSTLRRIGVWLVVGLLAAVAGAQTAPAATPAHPQGPFVQIVKLANHLNLSVEQKAQVKALLEGARQQLKAIREDGTLSQEQRREKVQGLLKQTRIDFAALLTPEQHARLVQWAVVRGPLAGIGRLGLNDTQKTEVKALVKKQQQDVRAIRQNTALTPEQKKQDIRQIRESAQRQFLTFLTPDQAKLWLQIHPHWGQAPATTGA